jgi:Uma2 family endonuclease
MTKPTIPASPSTPLPGRPGEPAWDVALLFPPQGDWSEAEYLALDTNRMVELSDGFLEVLPMPSVLHQLLVKLLHARLEAFVSARKLGVALFAPLPVRLWHRKFREPDIVFLRPGRITDPKGQPEGADLVMEVLSEGEENRQRDLVTKPQEYAAAGIAEYWIVDPLLARIAVLVLEGGAYREHGSFAPGQTATSVLLPGFEVPVSEVMAAAESAR